MNVLQCEQGSFDWHQARLGMMTSSRIADCIAKYKRKTEGEMACRRALKYALACELLTGRASEHYVSKWMEEGIEKEPDARALYEHLYLGGEESQVVGFVFHPDYPDLRAGCSPDSIVGEEGVVEFKCPKIETHIQYIEANTIPEEYLPQCMWHLACTGLQWCDFASFHPDMPKHRKLFVKRMYRNEQAISAMKLEAEQLQKEVDAILARIKERNRESLEVLA